MRFYLDEDLWYRIAEAARRLGVDVLATVDFGRNAAPDEDQLAFAASLGRCLVSCNERDFRPLTIQFAAEGRPHAGVLLVSPADRRDFGGLARSLAQFDQEHPEGMVPYDLGYLRVRRR